MRDGLGGRGDVPIEHDGDEGQAVQVPEPGRRELGAVDDEALEFGQLEKMLRTGIGELPRVDEIERLQIGEFLADKAQPFVVDFVAVESDIFQVRPPIEFGEGVTGNCRP